MDGISYLKNPVMEYDWGSLTVLPDLLGEKSPAQKPQAELWMGAHPNAPSQLLHAGVPTPLNELIQKNPEKILGKFVSENHSNKLPFLFKVLAAAQPLSIQVHPNIEQARNGFERENGMGIPLTAFNRNYKDINHKPEILCALTPFYALTGFRKIRDILNSMNQVDSNFGIDAVELLIKNPNRQGLKSFFKLLMTMDKEIQERLVSDVVMFAAMVKSDDPVLEWVVRLNQYYPEDIGALAPIFLNLVFLNPGEAIYLNAGELHAYLDGVGIELMANSDNVLRGGLTPKHIDVEELLAILNFKETEIKKLKPELLSSGEKVYHTEAKEFLLSVVSVNKDSPFNSLEDRSVEILICTEGEMNIKEEKRSNEVLRLSKGKVVIVPASVDSYSIGGQGTLYKATVPGPL